MSAVSSASIAALTTNICNPVHSIFPTSYAREQNRSQSRPDEEESYSRQNSENSRLTFNGTASAASSEQEASPKDDNTGYESSSTRPPTTSPTTVGSPSSQLPRAVQQSRGAKNQTPQRLRKRSSSTLERDVLIDHFPSRNGTQSIAATSSTASFIHGRGSSGDSSTSNICLCQPDPKIPRPRNAFILYRQHHQASITSQNPSLSNPEISKVLGEQWKAEPPEIKKDWKNLAEEEKCRHQQQYPEYRYQPRRTRRGSTADGSFGSLPHICNKCGNRTMVSPTALHSQVVSTTSAATASSIAPAAPTVSTTPQGPANFTAVTPPRNTSLQPLRPVLPPPPPPPPAQQNMPGVPAKTTSPHDNHRILPPMKSLSIAATQNPRKPNRTYPANIGVIPHNSFREYQDDGRNSQNSPDAKRRRFYGSYTPSTAPLPTGPRPALGTPYGSMMSSSSPYRDTFNRSTMEDAPRYSQHRPNALMPPPGTRPLVFQHSQALHNDANLTLPPIKDAVEARKSIEAMHMNIPFLKKIEILGVISPPFKQQSPPGQNTGRGTIVAVEGDDPDAVRDITSWLGRYLVTNEHVQCRLAQGPELPEDGKQITISDYHPLIMEWHSRSKEMVGYILGRVDPEDVPETTSKSEDQTNLHQAGKTPFTRVPQQRPSNERVGGSADLDNSETDMRDDRSDRSISPRNTQSTSILQRTPQEPAADKISSTEDSPSRHTAPIRNSDSKPVLILNHYQLHASNGYASRVLITDAYAPADHWQWMATLWRGIVGADLTVYVHTNVSPEDIAIGAKVEVNEGMRTMVLRKQRGANTEDKTLRRLGFEVGEWVRCIANGEGRGGTGNNSLTPRQPLTQTLQQQQTAHHHHHHHPPTPSRGQVQNQNQNHGHGHDQGQGQVQYAHNYHTPQPMPMTTRTGVS